MQEQQVRKIGRATFVIKAVPDNDPDLSWIGEFCNYRPGAIHRNPSYVERHQYEWFMPGNTFEDHYNGLLELKYSKGKAHDLARSYVAHDLQRLEDYDRGHWNMLGICVSMLVGGVEVASDSLWGIESDADEAYHEEVIGDLIGECQAQAHKMIVPLIKNLITSWIEFKRRPRFGAATNA